MPKFIGNDIYGSTQIDARLSGMLGLSYSQAKLLSASDVYRVLNTSDRGGIHCRAKRWWNWFAYPHSILACPFSTKLMRERALDALKVRLTS